MKIKIKKTRFLNGAGANNRTQLAKYKSQLNTSIRRQNKNICKDVETAETEEINPNDYLRGYDFD
jgi:hypothetical protein